MEVGEALQNLGLSRKESAIYLALLQLGEASAYSIALKSGQKRPTTYVVLEELRLKGFVHKIPRAKKQLYRAEAPEEVVELARRRLVSTQEALPKLMALAKGTSTKVRTSYYEGLAGLKQAMEYGLKDAAGGEMVGFYATSENLPKELTNYFDEWNDKRHKLGISVRVIAPDHPSLKKYRDEDVASDRQVKVVPYSEFSSQVAIDTSGDIVRIQDYKNLQGVVIENADVAKTVREIFEMVWKGR